MHRQGATNSQELLSQQLHSLCNAATSTLDLWYMTTLDLVGISGIVLKRTNYLYTKSLVCIVKTLLIRSFDCRLGDQR